MSGSARWSCLARPARPVRFATPTPAATDVARKCNTYVVREGGAASVMLRAMEIEKKREREIFLK